MANAYTSRTKRGIGAKRALLLFPVTLIWVLAYGPAAKTDDAAKVPQFLNDKIVEFCKRNMGEKVGNGGCSSLVQEAFKELGAQTKYDACPRHDNHQWGLFVCSLEIQRGRLKTVVGEAGENKDRNREPDVRAGDVIQFEGAKFERRTPNSYRSWNYPVHTAVVAAVSEDGSTCTIYEQNTNGRQYVVETELYLPDLTSGALCVHRACAKVSPQAQDK